MLPQATGSPALAPACAIPHLPRTVACPCLSSPWWQLIPVLILIASSIVVHYFIINFIIAQWDRKEQGPEACARVSFD